MTPFVKVQPRDPQTGKPLRQRYRETREYGGMVRRMIKAYGARVAGGDIEALRGLVDLRGELDTQIQTAVEALRTETDEHPPYSWTQIGEVLGMSKQGAFQRFGR